MADKAFPECPYCGEDTPGMPIFFCSVCQEHFCPKCAIDGECPVCGPEGDCSIAGRIGPK